MVWLVGAGPGDPGPLTRKASDQQTIGRRIVAAALAGERVVRLNGGDPAVFGRLADELSACAGACVPTRIWPGITAASAAAAR